MIYNSLRKFLAIFIFLSFPHCRPLFNNLQKINRMQNIMRVSEVRMLGVKGEERGSKEWGAKQGHNITHTPCVSEKYGVRNG